MFLVRTQGSVDRMGPERTGTPSAVPVLFWSRARNGVPVLFHDVERFISTF